MAYTGTAPIQYATICEGNQPAPGSQICGPNSAIVGFKAETLFPVSGQIYVPDAQVWSDLFSAIILFCGMWFVIAAIKKAIEQ